MRRAPTLGHAVSFLIIALIMGFLGFRVVIEGPAAMVVRGLFVIFLTLFVVVLVLRLCGQNAAEETEGHAKESADPPAEANELPAQEK